MNRVVVVTVSESFLLHGNDVALRCFSSHEKACVGLRAGLKRTFGRLGLIVRQRLMVGSFRLQVIAQYSMTYTS